MRKKDTFFLMGAILLGALVLRVYRLGLNVPPLFGDEVGGNYNALIKLFSPAPFFIRIPRILFAVFSTYIWFLGFSPLAVRLPVAIYGTVLVVSLYFFAKAVNRELEERNEWVGPLTSILVAVLPWSLHISRLAHTGVLIFMNLVSLHWIFYLKAQKTKKYLLSLLPLLLATYFYPSSLILTPLVFILVFRRVYFLIDKQKIKKYLMVFCGFLLMAVIFFTLALFRFKERGFELAIWRDVNVTADTDHWRSLARISSPTAFTLFSNPEKTNRFFFNYPVSVLNIFFRNYWSFFSPDFLFLKGDPVLRHSTQMVGVLYPFLAPFLVYGAFLLFSSRNRKLKEFFLFWILVSPLSAAITRDGQGYLYRVLTMLPLFTYLSALGLMRFLLSFKGKIRLALSATFLLIAVCSTLYFLYGYFQVYPALAAKSYEFGFKELSDFQVSHNSEPMLVIWDGYYPHFYFRFWQATPVREYSLFSPKDIHIGQSVFHQRYPNLYFSLPRKEADLRGFLEKNGIVYFAFPAILKEKFSGYSFLTLTPFKVVNYPDGAPAFEIYEAESWWQSGQRFENTPKVK